MTRRVEIGLGSALSIAVLLVALGATASAAPATVSGVVNTPAAKAPDPKATQTEVLAMNLDSGAFGDADTADRKGRYSLKLPPGKWALRSSLLDPDEKRYASFLSAAIVTKAGERRALPLTLKKFKKPRKRKRHKKRHHKRVPAAATSNVNPRDGRSYPGEAYAVRTFASAGGDAEFKVLAKGIGDMIVTDIVGSSQCEFTVVEWEQRGLIEKEIALQHSEYFDPATRVEEGHLIDPEIFIRGRLEERRGTPPRMAMVAWLEDAKTGAKISDEVSVVELQSSFFAGEQRFVKLILRDLICARAKGAPGPEGPAPGKEPGPKPVANSYTGSISGFADGDGVHTEWSGNLVLDAAQDSGSPPPGAPPGEYREFTVTQGSVFTTIAGETEEECVYSASGSNAFEPGFSNGLLTVQLDVPNPAYYLYFAIPTGTVDGSSTCDPEITLPIPAPLAFTEQAIVSGSTTLSGSESHSLFPGYGYTTSWNFSPG